MNERKRAPGGGRKPLADKIVRVDFWIRQSDLEAFGGNAKFVMKVRQLIKKEGFNLKD